MRSDRNVYVLGAGFSADAGIPTIASFLQTARQQFDAPSAPLPAYLEPHYKTVLKFRHAAKQSRDSLRLDLDNIETLFSMIDMISLAEPLSTQARKNADSIKHVIAHTVTANRRRGGRCEVRFDSDRRRETRLPNTVIERCHQPSPSEPNVTVLQFDQYGFFAALLGGLFEAPGRDVQDAVISFNYDTVLEEAIWDLGGTVDYGVSRVQVQGRRNTPQAGTQFVTPLFKLHGSSNWASLSARGVRAQIHDSYQDFGDRAAPLVVPPTWKKGELAPIFAEIWRGAREALAKATRICIIGYSMPLTDPFFHHLMASALGENDGLYRLDVVDLDRPDGTASPVVRRYRQVFEPLEGYGRLHFHTGGFGGFMTGGGSRRLALGRGAVIKDVSWYGPGS